MRLDCVHFWSWQPDGLSWGTMKSPGSKGEKALILICLLRWNHIWAALTYLCTGSLCVVGQKGPADLRLFGVWTLVICRSILNEQIYITYPCGIVSQYVSQNTECVIVVFIEDWDRCLIGCYNDAWHSIKPCQSHRQMLIYQNELTFLCYATMVYWVWFCSRP